MKPFTKVVAAGLSGVVLFKLFTTILIPLLGLFLGLIALTVKVALIAAVVFFLYSIFSRKPGESEITIEVEVDDVQDVDEVREMDTDDLS